MEHGTAIEFLVELSHFVCARDYPENILDESFDDINRTSIVKHFEFLDNQQLSILEDEDIIDELDYNIAILRNDFIDMISFEIIQHSHDQTLIVTEKQYDIAMIINETGEMPEWFWEDHSMDTALELGFFPRINSNGFRYAQMFSILSDDTNNIFYTLLKNVNNLVALKWFKENGFVSLK